MSKEKISIELYGETKIWKSREDAKNFFLDCMLNSEGSEHERYANIYCQLSLGKTECHDTLD